MPRKSNKIDRIGYQHYSLVETATGWRIAGGWFYPEDAQENVQEWKEGGFKSKKVTRKGAERLGLDPLENSSWAQGL